MSKKRASQGQRAFSRWAARQARGHPQAEEALRMLPPRIYESERAAHPGYDGLGFRVACALPVAEERMIELLRVLGRLYVVDVQTLYRMLYARRYDLRTTYNDLKKLTEQRLVWKATVHRSGEFNTGVGGPGRGINVYGLSKAGKQVLANLGVEVDDVALELLIARDTRGHIPKPSSLAHDLQVSWWCASMIEGLRLLPWCSGIYVQVEYNALKTQRADAFLAARFDLTAPRPDMGPIPWISDAALRPNEVELRWALELDNSTESTNVLVKKFITYRELHATGAYHNVLNGDVLLVLVVQNSRRAAYLSAEFSRAWPDGWGLVSTPGLRGANESPFGALWGTYLDMNTQQVTPLLSVLMRDADQRVVKYMDLLPYAIWLRYLELQKAGVAPACAYDIPHIEVPHA